MKPEFTAQNPIVAAAERIRARRELGKVIDTEGASAAFNDADAEASLRALADRIAAGAVRLNAILGEGKGVKIVRIERPLRVRLRLGETRLSLTLDDVNQLVRINGLDLDGSYQFVPGSDVPALINVSIVSTEAGYGDALTAASLLKRLAQDVELPRPPHLDSPSGGPLQF
jgi:hypothetical protein